MIFLLLKSEDQRITKIYALPEFLAKLPFFTLWNWGYIDTKSSKYIGCC